MPFLAALPDAMHEEFRSSGEVKIDNIIEEWKVDTAARDICDNHKPCRSAPETRNMDPSCRLIHRAVDDAACVTACDE